VWTRRHPACEGAGTDRRKDSNPKQENEMEAITDVTRERSFRPELAAELGTGLARPGWDLGTERNLDDGQSLARGMGWFSIGLGLMEVAMPGRISRWLGVPDLEGVVRLYGVREMVKGVGILSDRRPLGWMYGRIAGDALDLGTLAAALPRSQRPGNVALAMGAVAGATAGDVLCARQLARSSRRARERRDVPMA
jgi:hypothetical protein